MKMTRRFGSIAWWATAWPCCFMMIKPVVAGTGLAETISNSFLQSFTTVLKEANLYNALDTNYTNVTMLGPTDTAIASFTGTNSAYNLYLTNPAAWSGHLSTLLLFHLVNQELTYSEIYDGKRANLTTFAASGSLNISINQATRTLQQGGWIQSSDIAADNNALLQIITEVLIPTNMSNTLWQNLELFNIPQLPGKKARFNQDGYSVQNFLLNNATKLSQTLYSETSTNGTTVFVPPNSVYLEFIQRFFLGAVEIPSNAYFTTQYLQYHALPWNFYKATAQQQYGAEFHTPSLLGPSVWLTFKNDSLFFNGAHVFAPDQYALNGVAQMVSSIFPAPTTRDLLNYTTLATSNAFGELFGMLNQQNFSIGVIGTSLGGQGGTLFAPVDMAILDKFDKEVLLRLLDPTWHLHLQVLLFNHITAGTIMASELLSKAPFELTMANGHTIEVTKSADSNGQEVLQFGAANVFLTDLIGLDGVFHGIDQLIVPVELTRTLLDVIQEDSELTTLDHYINEFSLENNISDTLAITVLAPINAAWNSSDVIESLLGDIVEGQIIQQVWTTDALVDGAVLQSTNGQQLNVTRSGNDIFINGAKIIKGDILAENGVLHIMETVVLDYNTVAPPPVVAPTLQPVTNYPTPTLALPTVPTFAAIGSNGTACEARSGSACPPSGLNRTVIHFRPTDPPTPPTTSAAGVMSQASTVIVVMLSAVLVMAMM